MSNDNQRRPALRRALPLALWLGAALGGSAAQAAPQQEPAPTGHLAGAPAAPDQAARAHFARGAALFQERNYAGAWLEFSSAYQLSARPQLLYNMAKCERKLGRQKEALEHLRTYLKAVPNDPDAPLIRQELAELEEEVARLAQSAPPRQPDAPPPDVRPPGRPFPVYGTVAAGATLVLLVAGGAVLGSTQSKYDNLRNTCAPNCLPDQVNQLRAQATAGYALMGLAGAGAITAAVVLAIELRRGRAQAPAAQPQPLVQVRPVLGPLQVDGRGASGLAIGLGGSF